MWTSCYSTIANDIDLSFFKATSFFASWMQSGKSKTEKPLFGVIYRSGVDWSNSADVLTLPLFACLLLVSPPTIMLMQFPSRWVCLRVNPRVRAVFVLAVNGCLSINWNMIWFLFDVCVINYTRKAKGTLFEKVVLQRVFVVFWGEKVRKWL